MCTISTINSLLRRRPPSPSPSSSPVPICVCRITTETSKSSYTCRIRLRSVMRWNIELERAKVLSHQIRHGTVGIAAPHVTPHAAALQCNAYVNKSSPKSFGKSRFATPHGREWTRPLRVLPSVQ